jgi:hypothetical protein
MKHLFFVSVALGIFSGTSISVKAQTSVNLMRLSDGVAEKKSPHFIENIEIKPGTAVSDDAVIATVVTNKTVVKKAKSNEFGSTIETCSPLQFKYAQLMNVEVESLDNVNLYNFIEDWWATRYHYGGTGRNGIDCSAYSGTLLSQVWGLKTPRTARAMYDVAEKIDRENLKEGDLVFFNTRGGVSHVGVYLGNGYFTHASTRNGVTINNLKENYYKSKFIIGGRIAANADINCNE